MNKDEYSLKGSTEVIGQLVPTIEDKFGEIIDGFHRIKDDPSWKSFNFKALNVDTPFKLAIARLVVNTNRRIVNAKEKTRLLTQIYEEFRKEQGDYPPTEMIAKWLGRTERWVLEYLPDKFKDSKKSEAGRIGGQVSAERRSPELKTNQESAKVDTPEASMTTIGQREPITIKGKEFASGFEDEDWKAKAPKEPYQKGLSPSLSQNRQATYTPPHMRLMAELNRKGILYKSEEPKIREGEFTRDGKPKSYSLDIIVGDWLALEVEGDGSASIDNDERDEFFKGRGIHVVHIPNKCAEQFGYVIADLVSVLQMHRMEARAK